MIRGTKIKNMERELYIWRNIGIGKNSSVKEKEIATKEFLESNTDYNFYEVCKVITECIKLFGINKISNCLSNITEGIYHSLSYCFSQVLHCSPYLI